MQLIDELKAHVDVLVFDSPPLLQVADATLLTQLCDTVVLVATDGKTRTSALRQSANLLAQSGVALAGVVVNRARKSGHGYGYGYGYEPEPEQLRWHQRIGRLWARWRGRNANAAPAPAPAPEPMSRNGHVVVVHGTNGGTSPTQPPSNGLQKSSRSRK
ncbi:tyrosine-protein kinase family protein [Candidatus Viridilinea mediisalina]|uniref:AAA domain-containing protein n=1 Tax=Candidatus Viridilinea mediisalina TaxID=2024553 RepID=A0A2A6RJD1_9CHLR|nr:tyrosine-protein kinase family protein [Candidatus Viridilinea mediisalina]PDW03063.1 hypothetical protein CJ255_10780 [Candidatus Viridilinea mediisalina]